jgi:DNA end-binding protein Ku
MSDEEQKTVPHTSFWTGIISIGLVNVPVSLMVMVHEHKISFRQLHRKDGQPIHYKRVCGAEETEVAWEDIVKGYEVRDGEYLMIERDELKAIRPESDRRIRIDRFINVLEVDPVYFDRTYLLVPDEAPDAYALLREALRRKGRAGIGRITLRTREYPALVQEFMGALILHTLHYSDEITDLDAMEELTSIPEPGKKELALAERIIDELTGELDLTEYHDTYHERIMDLIEKKMEGGTVHVEEPEAAEAMELVSALEETIARIGAVK